MVLIKQGDRFVLNTDGLSEAENTGGEAFGDRRLNEVIRIQQNTPAGELSVHLLNELRLWQTSGTAQQDDITWIIIDVR
jgi:sigma-B regulation protein RsbU (phosphoserine phosphatase)